MLYAAKKLTRSDLTFFEYQYRRQDAGNQKSINLNRDVFVDLIFPAAGLATGGAARQFPVPVTIYGPGLRAQPHATTHKIIAAGGSQKNWRLNGKFVPDPEFDPSRYHELAAGDIAVFGFEGYNGLPSAVFIVLLSQAELADASVLAGVQALLGFASMAEVAEADLLRIVQAAPLDHPIRELAEAERDDALQEAALGSAAGAARLLRRPSSRRMSPQAFGAAREAAEEAGRNGEVLVDTWLRHQLRDGRLHSAVWISETNAVSPWDFEVIQLSGELVRVEVKSTTGPFNRDLHISQAEILAAAHPDAPRTDLYRVFALSDDGGWLKVSQSIHIFAKNIASTANTLPTGVVPDGYSVAPSSLQDWSDPIQLEFNEHED